MKKTLSLLLVATFIVCAFAACGGSTNYLSWKAADFSKASDTDKLKCTEAYINASLKATENPEITGEELTAAATTLQPILEEGLSQYPDQSIQELIDMSVAAQQGAETPAESATESSAAEETSSETTESSAK